MSLRALIPLARVLGMLALLSGAFYLGTAYERGQIAEQRSTQLAAQLGQLEQTAQALRQSAVDGALRHAAAVQRLDAIATERENDRADLKRWMDQQQQQLSALAARRPDLRHDAGPDVLRHWRQSNAGPNAEPAQPATAEPASKPTPNVPRATGPAEQPVDSPDRQPRSGYRPVPRLPQPAGASAASGPAVAPHRLGLVL